MGLSFKVARMGTRYRPKLFVDEKKAAEEFKEGTGEHSGGFCVNDILEGSPEEGESSVTGDKSENSLIVDKTSKLAESAQLGMNNDQEVSFTLNLFANGFCIGNPTEVFNKEPKELNPYNKAAHALLTAIEYGWLPEEIRNQISCKYVNGTVLCEIQDYRQYMSAREENSMDKSSPSIHQIHLHMSMENVVRDILSIKSKSFSNEILLEIESLILKALQPELNLNPEPLLGQISGESPPIKKLNLGINWSWKNLKKRKLNKTDTLDVGGVQEANSESGLANQDSEVPTFQQNVSSAIPNLQEKAVEVSHSSTVASDHNSLLVDGCNKSGMTDPSSSTTNYSRDMGESALQVLAKGNRCGTQATEGPMLKKPKEEHEDLMGQELLSDLAEMNLASDLSQKKNLLHNPIEAQNTLNERVGDKRESLQLIDEGKNKILEGGPNILALMPRVTVKQETIETSYLPHSNVRKINNNFLLDMRNTQGSLQEEMQQHSPATIPTTHNVLDKVMHPVTRNSRNKIVSQKRTAIPNSQSSPGVRAVSWSSEVSFPREASILGKRRINLCDQSSNMKSVGSLAGTRNTNVAVASHSSFWNRHSKQASDAEDNPYPGRFQKIIGVTQRYRLNVRKHKVDRKFRRKYSSFYADPVDCCLKEALDSKSKHASAVNGETDVSKTRTLTFVRPSYDQGDEICHVPEVPMVKLVLSETNEGRVDTSVFYGDQENDHCTDFSVSPTVTSTNSAEAFPHQFISLITDEGYFMASDFTQPPADDDAGQSMESATQPENGSSSGGETSAHAALKLPSQTSNSGPSSPAIPLMTGRVSSHYRRQPWSENTLSVGGREISARGALQLPSQTSTPGPSSSMLSPVAGIISSSYPRQLQLGNSASGSHSRPSTSFQPPSQYLPSNFPVPQLCTGAQVSHMQPQQPQILNRRAYLQSQMIQRQRMQEQLARSAAMIGDLSLPNGSVGMAVTELGGGFQGLGNTGVGSAYSHIGAGGYMTAHRGLGGPSAHSPMGAGGYMTAGGYKGLGASSAHSPMDAGGCMTAAGYTGPGGSSAHSSMGAGGYLTPGGYSGQGGSSAHGPMGPEGYMAPPLRGQAPWIGNMNEDNNVGNSTPRLNDMIQHFNLNFPLPGVLPPEKGAAQGQGGGMISGIPMQTNTGVMQAQTPNTPDTAYLLSNQHLPRANVFPQLEMLPAQQQQQQQQQGTSSLLFQPAEVASHAPLGGQQQQFYQPNPANPMEQNPDEFWFQVMSMVNQELAEQSTQVPGPVLRRPSLAGHQGCSNLKFIGH